MKKIPDAVRDVIAQAEITLAGVRLVGQLDRKLYQDVNKVLEAAGGKWNRKLGLHTFEGDTIEILAPIIETGEYRNIKSDLGQFDTPDGLAADLVELAGITPGMLCLEPSAGVGNIAAAMVAVGAVVRACEIDPARAKSLIARGILSPSSVHVQDFLVEPAFPLYDRIVMNPPFAGKADIKHVTHALKFLRAGGRLVSVMSVGVMQRGDRVTQEFMETIAKLGGSLMELPDDSFKASGTRVRTCVLRVENHAPPEL